jgi:CheY-like chemotaxis protein
VLRSLLRSSVALVGVVVLAGTLLGDDPKPPVKDPPPKAGPDYRDLFKKPETTLEFWKALNFEVDVGRYELAAKLLRGMLDPKPEEPVLADIADKEGLSSFLRFRNIPKWSEDPKVQAQAKKDVEELIGLATAALKKKIGDENTVNRYVRNLSAEPEKRDFAIIQLRRLGADAAPYLIDGLVRGNEQERNNILYALRHMDRGIVPPLLAALDMDDPRIKVELVNILEQRAETAAVPYLWHIAASPKNPDYLRNRAREALALLLQVDKSQLPPAKEMLTKEAERYYQHHVRFPDSQAVLIWRWDNGRVVTGWPGMATVSPSQAEEYYGLRFARQALDIDPEHRPAQVAFLSLVLEKALERSGLGKPLATADPQAHDLLTKVNPELVTAVLERGLADQNLAVIIGAAQALGELGEVKAARPTARGDAALVRALNYPNRRVSFAAADALLRLPQLPAPEEPRKPGVTATSFPAGRIVEVLRRATAAEPAAATARVLVVHNNLGVLTEIEKALKDAGYDVVPVRTGKEGLRRLNEAADVDAVLVDWNMPDPQLPYFLGQVRADVNSGLLPVLVMVPPDREPSLRRVTERYRNVHLVPPGFAIDVEALKKILPVLIADAVGKPPDEAELRDMTERSLGWLARIVKGEKKGFDIRPAVDAVVAALRSGKLGAEATTHALEVLSRVPGEKAQVELANALLDQQLKAPERVAAGQELVRHIQAFGVLLPANQRQLILDTYKTPDLDSAVRAQVAVVLGSLRPDARSTGIRLKDFQPTPMPPPAPMPPMPPKNDK